MKYFKKFLILGLFTLLFFGLGFCNAGSYTYTGSFNFQKNRSTAANIQYTYLKFLVPLNVSSRDFDTIYLNCSIFDLNYGNTDFYNFLSSGTGAVSVAYYNPDYTANSYNYPSFVSTTLKTGYSLNGFTNFSYSFDSNYLSSLTTNYGPYSFVSYVNFDLTRITKSSSEFNMSINDGYLNFKYSCVVSGSSVLSFTGVDYSCPSCPTCEDQYTSFECQTEYNLIPISEVTENYCTANFDLISPLDCPSSGSGDFSRSALYVNNVQYNGAPNLYVNINDLLDYSMTYVSGSAVIDVDGYIADTGYMSDILTIQEYHPSSEDFTVAFVSVLTYALPYVIVSLFVLFIWKLIKKIFKS